MTSLTSWHRFLDALGPAATARLALRPPATEAAIVGAETLFERALPPAYRALLAYADGQEPAGTPLFPEARLLPVAQVVEHWLTQGQFVIPEWDALPVEAELAVRPIVFHPTRIPIAADYLGAGPLIDLWPGPAGTAGQLIQLVSECDFEVLAPSLDVYLARRADELAR